MFVLASFIGLGVILEGGVALYRGPFLDGFFLKDAPEFERWPRISPRGSAPPRAGIPGGPSLALELVRALAAAGVRGGALAAARHEDLLRQELEVEPDRRFIEAVARLR